MDILWSAAGICAIVFVVFFALAQHWQRILRQQSLTIRRLSDRIRDLQEVVDPEFRRLSESSPMPLDRVFHFTFRLGDHFWRQALNISAEDWQYVRAYGTFVGSVKLEMWRSHTEATVTEVLPEGSAAQWQTRIIDFYPDPANRNDGVTLWELRLAPTNGTAERAPSLELVLTPNSLELHSQRFSCHGIPAENGHSASLKREKEDVIFKVPLDPEFLPKFRSHDRAEELSGDHLEDRARPHGSVWQAFYSHTDETIGVEWELRLRDLNKKAQWERWKILESPAIPHSAQRR